MTLKIWLEFMKNCMKRGGREVQRGRGDGWMERRREGGRDGRGRGTSWEREERKEREQNLIWQIESRCKRIYKSGAFRRREVKM